jgi:hypothetical protein
MPIYLITAYVIFCGAPLALAISLALRRRRVEREICELQTLGDF